VTSSDGVARPHPGRVRGERRRAQLVDAGIEVLAERGWASTTARAVADRAGAQLGLIHYHFGGFPQLKRAITAAVIDEAFQPVLRRVAESERWQDGLAHAVEAGTEDVDGMSGRLTAELVVASLQDEEVREQLREALAAARRQMTGTFRARGVAADDAEGLAVVGAALLDGLLLHRLIDRDLPLTAAAEVLRTLD